MPVTNWKAPQPGDIALASDVNQFLGTHDIVYSYVGTNTDANSGAITGSLPTNDGVNPQWVAQSFTTGGGVTSIVRCVLSLTKAGTGADVTIQLRTDDGSGPPSKPTSSVIASVVVPLEFIQSSVADPSTFAISFPLNNNALTASTKYWIVVDGTASTTNYVNVRRTAAVAGKHAFTGTGANGPWTDSTFSAYFAAVTDVTGFPVHTFEDAGARWTSLFYTSSLITGLAEYTGALRSVRTLTYAGGSTLIRVA